MVPRQLLLEARQAGGLSMRALAQRAGTSTSTVARIEAGTMDPTVGMLQRLLLAAGRNLQLSTGPAAHQPELADLHDAWWPSSVGNRPDWTRLRGLLDHLALHPEAAADALRRPPARSGSAVMDALLAGIADKVADDHALPRPRWTSASFRRLADVWESPGTPAMRARARRATPPQLLDHGLVVSTDSLWRRREAARA